MNMSFALTTDQMRNYAKTVTRRYGWNNIYPRQILWSVEKGMGLKKGEKVQRIHEIQVLHNRWERLNRMITEPEYGEKEVILEGFPDMKPKEFVEMLCDHNKKLPTDLVNRIEFRFLERSNAVRIGIVHWIIDDFFYYPDGTIGGRRTDNPQNVNEILDKKFRFELS